ncbi:uncharacterized protein LOC135931039 isoform X2 [Gordionus sp. m RMFG-2023]|uniref:uncharacterized protein LOC135931039 isoform X2 n=1 Tax=Gordionus sp. m RMFG-2023 TaxID=3053472 RepID=UPI0031FD6A12
MCMNYPNQQEQPARLFFCRPPFHPQVHPTTGELDLRKKFANWDDSMTKTIKPGPLDPVIDHPGPPITGCIFPIQTGGPIDPNITLAPNVHSIIYDPEEPTDHYLERFMLIHRHQPEANLLSLFLSSCGHSLYSKLKLAFSPRPMLEMSIEDVKTILGNNNNNKGLSINKLRQRIQQDGETITEYAEALIALASQCDLGSWDLFLSSQFGAGIQSSGIRGHVITSDNITFKGKLKIAQTWEMAVNQNNATNHAYSNQINIPTIHIFKTPRKHLRITINPHVGISHGMITQPVTIAGTWGIIDSIAQ